MADPEIRIIAANTRDISTRDLESLAKALRRELPETDVTVTGNEIRRTGVTFWEVLNIVVPWSELPKDAFMASVGIVAREAVAWAQRRRKKRSPHRPKYIGIRGPHGEILKSILVETSGDEVDKTQEDLDRAAEWEAYKKEHPDA